VLRIWGEIWKKVYVVCGHGCTLAGGALAAVVLTGGKHPAIPRPYQTNERHLGLAETNFITDAAQSECCAGVVHQGY